MQVSEIMTRGPAVVTAQATVADAWDALRSLDVRHLPVVNEEQELVGIVSDRDLSAPPVSPLMDQLLGPPVPKLDAPVAAVMSASPLSVGADDDVREVVELMIDNKIGAVPVVDPEGKIVGIVSYLDVLKKI
jgi:acetoin utilization protein AcuB